MKQEMKQGKKQRMRRAVRLLAALAAAVVLQMLAVGSAAGASANYETKSYDVEIVVSENGVLSVTETMDVDFHAASHGIYRYIPYEGVLTYEEDGKERKERYAVKIENIQTPDYEKEISHENGSVLVRIGSEDSTVKGLVTYRMSYDVTLYEDRNEKLDQLYWDLLPTDTPAATEQASFRIVMPKEFDASKAAFIAGAYGEADGDAVDFRVEGNTIYGETNRSLAAGEGVTLRVELDEGYFVGAASRDWMMTAMWILIVMAPATAALLWLVFGRDRKIVPTVEFYPPEGVTSAEIGYILDGASDDRDVVSLVLYFAEKGCLEIREEEQDVFRLIKKKELPQEAKSYERAMFSGLFRKGDSVRLDELKGEFYDTFVSVKQLLAAEFTDQKGRKVYTRGSKLARLFGLLLMVNPLLAAAILGTGYQYRGAETALIALPLALLVFFGLFWLIYVYDKKDHMTRGSKTGGRIGGCVTAALGFAGFLVYGIMMELALPAAAAAAASLICGVFAMLMKQRTPYSVQQMGKILGLKEFIRTAELPRLQLLVEETPDYFYRVLPYAYVFGLTDKWAKNFEGIAVPQPAWYSSPYGGNLFTTYYFLHSLNSCTRAMQNNIAVPPAGEGSGGGVGGGGFSGGGFSGGGMGGGGMGSW